MSILMNAADGKPGGSAIPEPFIPDLSEGLETGLYLALLELVDEGLIITGDEVVLEANSAACKLLEREYREVVGKPLENLFPSQREFLQARARLFIQGEMRGSLQLSLPGGRRRLLRFVAAARLRPGVHAIILSRDLLSDSAPEALSLPAADTLWPRLAAALEQPVIVLDDQLRVSAANSAALASLAIRRDQLVGQPITACLDIVWPTEGSAPLAQIAKQDGVKLIARVLPGPKDGWRVLVLPAVRHTKTSPDAAAAAPETTRTTRQTKQSAQPDPAAGLTRLAIARNELEIQFQPLVDARNHRIKGGEALLRWHHPTHGLTPYGKLTELVRSQDAIANLSDWALQAACRQAASWSSSAEAGHVLTVNIAAGQLVKGDLVERVSLALQVSGLPAARLELDFDESILCDDESRALLALNALKQLGVMLAIDDFGRGASSIPRLKTWPLQAIKLDPALVRKVGHDETSEAIVEAIARMTEVLNLRVFARGVENKPQQAFLNALGCHLQQGPLFGPPMSCEAFGALLKSNARARTQ